MILFPLFSPFQIYLMPWLWTLPTSLIIEAIHPSYNRHMEALLYLTFQAIVIKVHSTEAPWFRGPVTSMKKASIVLQE